MWSSKFPEIISRTPAYCIKLSPKKSLGAVGHFHDKFTINHFRLKDALWLSLYACLETAATFVFLFLLNDSGNMSPILPLVLATVCVSYCDAKIFSRCEFVSELIKVGVKENLADCESVAKFLISLLLTWLISNRSCRVDSTFSNIYHRGMPSWKWIKGRDWHETYKADNKSTSQYWVGSF